jgi:DNA-binding GntR family transcriptional regulator
MSHEAGRTRLVDEIADRLREKIYAGEYAPGDRLRQEQLAAELQVSRTPLREALRMLERDGLLVVSPSRGMQVVSAERAQMLSAYEVREVLDGLAARLAAQRCDRELERQLRRQVETQHIALHPWNVRLWMRLNGAFHSTILEYAGNAILLQQLALVRLTAQVFCPQALLDPQHAAVALEEHRQIADRIGAGDSAAAEAAARAHIQRAHAALCALAPEPSSASYDERDGKEGHKTSQRSRRVRSGRLTARPV